MSDVNGATAESIPAPELPLDTPNPIVTEDEGHPVDDKAEVKSDKPEAKAKPSIDDALDKAAETVEKASKAEEKPKDAKAEKADAKPEAKTEVKAEAKRADNGQFASDKPKVEAKPSHTAGDAPSRVSDDVKKIWPTLPENARAEWTRMHQELTAGYEKHKAGAERDATLNEFHEMAAKSGKQLPNVLREYVNMENTLRQDLVGGLDEICQRMGVSFKDVAAHVLNQTPDQNASQQDATVRELKSTIARLEHKVGTVSQTVEQQMAAARQERETTTLAEVNKFAADKPLFEILAPHIADEMRTSGKTDLDAVYNVVLQKFPQLAATSKTAPAASSAPVIDLAAQTAKGSKSISGAPNAGSSPAGNKRRSKSIDESLDRAFAGAS